MGDSWRHDIGWCVGCVVYTSIGCRGGEGECHHPHPPPWIIFPSLKRNEVRPVCEWEGDMAQGGVLPQNQFIIKTCFTYIGVSIGTLFIYLSIFFMTAIKLFSWGLSHFFVFMWHLSRTPLYVLCVCTVHLGNCVVTLLGDVVRRIKVCMMSFLTRVFRRPRLNKGRKTDAEKELIFKLLRWNLFYYSFNNQSGVFGNLSFIPAFHHENSNLL